MNIYFIKMNNGINLILANKLESLNLFNDFNKLSRIIEIYYIDNE